jgi:AraC-like DNA-binding protein
MRFAYQPLDGMHLHVLAAHWLVPTGWNHADLRAPYWRLYWNEQPGMSLRSDGRVIRLLPGRIVMIPPETPFSAETDRAVMHFYVHFLTVPGWLRAKVEILQTTSAEREYLSGLVQTKASGRWRIPALVADCLDRLPDPAWDLPHVLSERIQAVLEEINTQLPRALSVDHLARSAGMNVNAFIRLFREQTGQTPAAYMLDRRLATAGVLLHHSGHSIERIAEDCGFCDRHHFTRAFSRQRGISPAAFRRQLGAAV